MNENKNGRRLEKATRREVLPLVVIFGILAVLSVASLVDRKCRKEKRTCKRSKITSR